MILNLFKSKSSSSNITVILCAYNRPQFLDEQIIAIRQQSVPVSDIWLWYNQGSEPQKPLSDVKVAYCNYNFKFC